ncbi:cytochrome P450 [Kaistia dalseonensis]|uniref:Cytochrome P450 n=1 Tax=Kaistia dalseonensis TaxID=410840 RepID=A0ABU0H455_9HYPH|nr:cytochrome P450 [Kaistia dalseonensis]MCX5494491.1 cytochrome P450 [Kaistia dalseonensis]MDQ0437070.1 cytochrome P450 [Kaistia dalseonensis]
MTAPTTPFRFDPLSEEFAADPYAVYARMRAFPGLFPFPELDMLLVTRQRDVAAIVADKRLPRMPLGILDDTELDRRQRQDNFHDMPNHARFVQFSMLNSDGEVHDRLRRQVYRMFTPALIAGQRAAIEDYVTRLVSGLVGAGEVDFVAELAVHVPGHVIGHLLGVPEADCPMLRRWSENIVQYFDVDRSEARKALAESTAAEFASYLRELKAERLRAPKDDLVTRLVEAERSGAMSEDEFISTAMLILMAGHGSTIDVLGSGMHALLRFPDEMQRLKLDPSLMATAVQEMFRFESPLPFFDRYAAEEVEIGGTVYPRGTRFGLLYGAANRDPEQFDEPDSFDVGRTPNRHLAFGGGAHFCLGNHLARLDMDVIFTTLFETFRSIELAETPEYKRSLSVRGPRALRLKLEAA